MGIDSEDELNYFVRKANVSQIIQETIQTGGDASTVRTMAFSGRYGTLGYVPATSTSARERRELPQSSYAYERERYRAWRKSRDGEMFMLDAVDRILDQYLDEHVLENGGYSRDEIRVEMVGPQGTCTDCQAGLTLWLTDTNKYFDNKGWPLKVSLRTRWTSGRAEMQGMRPNARDLSHTYGTLGAYPKNGLKGAADQHGFRAPAPHHKLKF